MKKSTIIRLYYLLEKINSGMNPNFENLRLLLENHDIAISHRTLQRDIESLRNTFGIEIIYNRSLNYYVIDHEISNNVSNILLFMSKSIENNLFEIAKNKSKSIFNYIEFEDQGQMKGIELLSEITNAIHLKRKISFSHFNFHKESEKKYEIIPYILKQYQNRWYIVGKTNENSIFQSFGLDRISEFRISKEKYKLKSDENVNSIFKNTIGITFDEESEIIELKIDYPQAHYFKTLPWHFSQEILKDDKIIIIVKLNLVINFELKQKILSLGSKVKVLSPKWLVSEIKNELKKTIKIY